MCKMIEVFMGGHQMSLVKFVEDCITLRVGSVTYEEGGVAPPRSGHTCWTVEFDSFDLAQKTKIDIESKGIHVEGPCEY